MSAPQTVAFHTLGCKLNFSESSSLSRLLEQEGFAQRPFEESADVYVINTCSVTENADKECRHLVRRIQRRAPGSFVVITGCYAQLKPSEIATIPGVDLVLGAAEKFNIARHLRELMEEPVQVSELIRDHDAGLPGSTPQAPGSPGSSSPRKAKICSCDIADVEGFNSSWSLNHRARTFLKVQDGCDYNCSFCTIPMARGKSRSDLIQNVVNNAAEIGRGNTREIVLTGINLGDFGKRQEPLNQLQPASAVDDPGTPEDFLQLIQALDQVEGIDRYRISSIEPNLLTNTMIEWVAGSKKFMPHFHIPLQSGSNRILGAMRRRYRRELYAERVSLIRELMPHASIGVDVIVGFPGEGAAEFEETRSFLHELEVSYLHVFTYSERPNTHALNLKPVVPIPVRQERNRVLRNLSYMKSRFFQEQHTGQTRKVLFENPGKDGMIEGYSDNYIKVTAPAREDWVNQIVDWKL